MTNGHKFIFEQMKTKRQEEGVKMGPEIRLSMTATVIYVFTTEFTLSSR